MTRKPYRQKDLSWTRWTPADIRREADRAVRFKRSAYAAIRAVPDEDRTFENTLDALDRAGAEAGQAGERIGFLMQVAPSAAVRNAAEKAALRMEHAFLDLDYNIGIYRAVSVCAARRERLGAPERKLLRDTLRAYRRMGFGRPAAVRTRAKANLKKLRAAETAFSRNINEWKDRIAVRRDELDGLPERYIAGLKRDRQGRYLISLDYPESVPFMRYAKSAVRRAELARKEVRKGGPANMAVLARMVRLREENAKLLGYATHADYRLETRMAKKGSVARAFVDRLMRRLRPALRRDLSRLTALKREMTSDPRARLEHGDIAYYSTRLEERDFRINAEEIREYFPLETVKRGTFAIYERLLGLRFTRMRGFRLWHPDAELYRIDDAGGEFIGHFALDLYPREGKYGHAAAFSIAGGYGDHTPLDAMVANFPKPAPGRPSLLSHDEVEVFFHEFGHVMHATLSTVRYASQAGTSVAWDFVEAPSQMFEYWVWDKRSLALLSGHWKDPKRGLPPAMLRNLLRSKKHLVAYQTCRQLTFADFDLSLHTGKVRGDAARFYRTLVQRYFGIALPKDALFPAGFGHLTNYDAGYYGYLWSRVYAADMFTRFRGKHLLDPAVGRAYRRAVLESGSSREEMDLVTEFLGRKPNEKAFLKEIEGRT